MKMEQAKGHHKYQNFQFKCGLFISAVAVIALFGWSFNITYFKSFASGFIGMNPMIALNFIAFGIWLLARKNHTTPVFNLTVFVVLINSFIVIPKIVALFYPQSFQVDTLLFAQLTKVNKIQPATAFNFFLLNIAFLISFSKHKSKEFIYQALVIFCLGVSAIYLCGYLFNFNSLIGVSALTPMALNTCICFIVLSAGLMLTYPDKGYMKHLTAKKLGGSMSRRILPFLMITPIITGALRIYGQHLNLYNTELGVAIHVVVVALLSFILAYYFAKKLNEIDAVRQNNEYELLEISKQLHESEMLLQQTESLAKVGGWEIVFPGNKISYTKEMYSIKELEDGTDIHFDNAISSYTPEYTEILLEHYKRALKDGQPYEVEAKLITAKNREIWVKIIGQPVKDNLGNIIALRGTIQDIDESKKKELLLNESMEIINDQNKRLMNFTHIVSHNLRTHAGNIRSTLSIYDDEESEEEKALILNMTKSAADSLNQTIADLSDIISVQSASKQLKSRLYFADVFTNTINVLDNEIKKSHAIIETDFSQCEEIDYVPAYLESIFHNFISNAIRYSKADVRPEVKISTSNENGKITMTFSDNGLGIDLVKNKDKLFGMYKTFHNHPDSTGVGLFLTKNQIESLGGDIAVESEVNIGTTFKIVF